MIINHNMSSANANRQIGINSSNANKSMEKLSSGLRINRAGDDAAGLAISEKMRGQIRGLDQASGNAQDSISMIQTAEGALSETHSILQRMRELAVQSANDTNNDADRGQIQKEVDQLKSEITRISTDTEFNTKKLLNGDMGKTYVATADTMSPANLQVVGSDITTGTYQLEVNAIGTDTVTLNSQTAATALVAGDITAAAGTKYGDYNLQVVRGAAGTTADVTLTGPGGSTTSMAGVALNSDLTIGGITFNFDTNPITTGLNSSGSINFSLSNVGLDIDLTGAKSVNPAALTNYKGETLDVGGFQFDMTWKPTRALTDQITMNVTDKAVKFQIGANANQNTSLSINDMSAAALGVANVNVSNQTGANTAITTIQNAIDTVSSERAKLGANQNRLEHTIANLGTSSENLTSAESRIRDVNMAKEMSTFSKNNILSQAAQAMLAQANQQPQQVLQLLR